MAYDHESAVIFKRRKNGQEAPPKDEKKEEKPKKNEEDKNKNDKPKTKAWSLVGSGLLITLVIIEWLYFTAFSTGFDKIWAPINMLKDSTIAQYIILLSVIIVSVFLLGIKMGKVSWGAARIFLIIGAVLMGLYILPKSLYKEEFAPRRFLTNMLNAQASTSRTGKTKTGAIIINESYIVKCENGKPSPYYWPNSNNFKFLWKKDGKHFIVETRSGRKFTPNDLKKRAHFGNEDFRVVPTEKRILKVCVEPT